MYIKKNDQQKIKTIFYTKSQIIKEYWFKITSTIKEIFNYFEKHIKEEGYSLKSIYKILGKKINESYTISELIKKGENDSVISGEIWIEVEEEIFYDDENDEIFYTILQPKVNPFELIEYDILKKRIKIVQFPKDIFLFCNLNKFSKESAFCNSNNSLYISGGEVSGKAINNFWIINKNNYKINKKTMPIDKKYHSMLYIPDNFIFIAGGDSFSSIIYDIENQEFIKWANMNKKHFQPGLLINGDYIYAFSSLNDVNKKNNFFEKTNLTSKNAKWEIIYPKYSDDNIKINAHFFGVCKFLEGNILFVGGEKNNSNYIYNPWENVISISNGKNTSFPFWDKTFYKIDKKYNINIPLNFSINHKLALLNKETESLEEINYNENTGHVKLNLDKDNKPGNIYIQSTLRNAKNKQIINIQFGLSPKNILKKMRDEYNLKYIQNNKINSNDDNKDSQIKENRIIYNEEKIIIDNYNNNTEYLDNQNLTKYNKNYQKKKFLYIPDSIIDDQMINREVDLIENKKKNEGSEKSVNSDNKEEYTEKDIEKEEYIFIGDLNGIEEVENNFPISKKNALVQKQFLYIPKSSIDDQIIDRELIFNKNNNNLEFIIKNDNSKNKNIDEIIPEIKIDNKKEDNEDIIIIDYENDIYGENNNNEIKFDKNNKFLYIPYSSIDDHLIDRKVEIKENNIKNSKSLTNRENSKPYIKKRIEPLKDSEKHDKETILKTESVNDHDQDIKTKVLADDKKTI